MMKKLREKRPFKNIHIKYALNDKNNKNLTMNPRII